MTVSKDEKTESQTDVPFSSPLSFELGDNGGTVVLTSFGETLRWAETELRAWKEIIGETQSPYEFVRAIAKAQLHTPQTLYDISESALCGKTTIAEGMTLVRRGMNTYLTFQCVHSCGILGRAAAIMYR